MRGELRMGLIDTLFVMVEGARKERERNLAIQEEIIKLMASGERWHEWSVGEIRNQLSMPTSIYDVEKALKAIVKKHKMFKKKNLVRYTFG
jgi:hypothetical protein